MAIRVREIQSSYRIREVEDDGLIGRQLVGPSTTARMLAAYPACEDANRLDHSHVERFLVVLLNTRMRVSSVECISVGSMDSSIVTPRAVFREACRVGAASLMVCHNHPSGDPQPSEDDILLTERLVAAGTVLGISVCDHIVIGHDGSYYSMHEKGLI